jgi:hypothetical protein
LGRHDHDRLARLPKNLLRDLSDRTATTGRRTGTDNRADHLGRPERGKQRERCRTLE